MTTFKKLAGLAFYYAVDKDYLSDALYEYVENKYPEEYAKACEKDEAYEFVFDKMAEEFEKFFGFSFDEAEVIG